MSCQPQTKTNPLFNYTSGRWLWNERERREARYRYFDVSSLQHVACQALGASKCISFEKIGEGNYNKAYRIKMEDGQKVTAKIPHPNAGPKLLTTTSEVATMDFVRTVLNILVPKALAWSATDQNPVQAEYIIMEEAKGSQLHEVWQELPLRKKCDIVREFVDVERKLLSVSFAKYGPANSIQSLLQYDLHLAGWGHYILETVVWMGASLLSLHLVRKMLLGKSNPVIASVPSPEESSRRNSAVPCHVMVHVRKSSTEYLQSVTRREIDWINNQANPERVNETPWQYTTPEQYSPEAHITLLHRFLSTIPHIVPKDPELVSPRLWHPNFHAGNIYVDDQARISSIIDWQGAWTTPAFIGANPPLLLDYATDMLMKLPNNFKELDEATKDQLRYQVSQSVLIHPYETLTAERNPLTSKVMRHPHGQTLKQLDAFVDSTWNNCLYPFEKCLIRVENEWSHFDTNEPCPYNFTAEEIYEHYEEAESFNKSQEFWKGIQGVLTDEGYASNESYDKAVKILKDLREAGLTGLEGEERRNFDKEAGWVADLDQQISRHSYYLRKQGDQWKRCHN